MAMKKEFTREQLEDECGKRVYEAVHREKETRARFDDLKERLAQAEDANQFMRGYLARVQEDDTVREELIETGDPLGEQHLIPKRKPTPFLRPRATLASGGVLAPDGMFERAGRTAPRARHWVNY